MSSSCLCSHLWISERSCRYVASPGTGGAGGTGTDEVG